MKSFSEFWYRLLPAGRQALLADVGLLLIRLQLGAYMLFAHGLGKLKAFPEARDGFPDPLGVSPPVSMALAVFAEFFCSILLALGLFSRFAALNLLVTMLVAGLLVHGADPFSKKELALVYLAGYVLLLFSGPGRFSLDRLLVGAPPSRPEA